MQNVTNPTGDLRVDDCLNDESVSLNYVPALTMQHKYALLTLFPHEIKMAGETGGQFSLFGELPMGLFFVLVYLCSL